MNNIQNLQREKQWERDGAVLPFLAERLAHGNLLIFLGAGVSRFYGMPGWEDLLSGLTNAGLGHTVAKGNQSMPAWAESIQHKLFPNDKQAFNDAISASLYENPAKFDLLKVSDNKTLRSIGALCHGSRRGRVNKVITLNYDCLLEAYFRFHGIEVQTIHTPSFLERDCDVSVFHPHGYIPHSQFGGARSEKIVLARDDFEEAMETQWQETMLGMLSTHFVLFVGVSGEDDRISALVSKAKKSNPFMQKHELPYYALRICSRDDPMKTQWESRGVFCKEVGSLGRSIPKFLFSICREAALRSVD